MEKLLGKPIKEKLLSILQERADLTKKVSFYLYSDKDSLPSAAYLRSIKKLLTSLNINFEEGFINKEDSRENNLSNFKKDAARHTSIIMARPLNVDYENDFILKIGTNNDPDMMSDVNKGKLYSGDLRYLPATAKAVKMILEFYNIDVTGKKAFVLGRSNTVGLPVFELLNKKNALVSIAHSRVSSEEINKEAKNSDYIFLCTGKEGLIKKESFSKDAVIIDCGYSRGDGGGDLGFIPEEGSIKAYTPVPGGVGTITSLCLIINAIFLATGVEITLNS